MRMSREIATDLLARATVATLMAFLSYNLLADFMRTGRLTGLLLLRSEEHTSELQSQSNLVCRLLLEKKKTASVPPIATMIAAGTSRFLPSRQRPTPIPASTR